MVSKVKNKKPELVLDATDRTISKVYDFFVKESFYNYVDFDEEEISPETRLDELGLDSLDLLELCMDAELEFTLDIRDEDFEDITSVGGLVLMVANKIKDKQ